MGRKRNAKGIGTGVLKSKGKDTLNKHNLENSKRRTVLHELKLRDFAFGGLHCYSMKAGVSRYKPGDEVALILFATNLSVNIERLLSENAGPLF